MKRKEKIVESATSLFAAQGFEATTTLQIALKSGVTEPLIYYHFAGKDELFTHILENSFNKYFNVLYDLPKNSTTEFTKIINLFEMHFHIVDEFPETMRLIISNCPAKLYDPESVCGQNYQKARHFLFDYFKGCLMSGIKRNEFRDVSLSGTANMLVALTNGLLRQLIFKLGDTDGVKEATTEFCKNSLLIKCL